jgi:hypothetical protein
MNGILRSGWGSREASRVVRAWASMAAFVGTDVPIAISLIATKTAFFSAYRAMPLIFWPPNVAPPLTRAASTPGSKSGSSVSFGSTMPASETPCSSWALKAGSSFFAVAASGETPTSTSKTMPSWLYVHNLPLVPVSDS